jgi:hypothetical protein
MRLALFPVVPMCMLVQACKAEPSDFQGASDEDTSASELSMGAEDPFPAPGGLPGGRGDDHTWGMGDGHRHTICDDPQYAGLCNPSAISGAADPRSPDPGISKEKIAASKKARRYLENRGWKYLNKHQDLGEDPGEALSRSCVDSCTVHYSALCEQIANACITGDQDISLSPGVITPCRNAVDAACRNKPDRCLAGCFNSATNSYFAKNHSEERPPIGVSPKWREACHLSCGAANIVGCGVVTYSCVAGSVWTYGAIAIPCKYAVVAACLGAYAADRACEKWCDL